MWLLVITCKNSLSFSCKYMVTWHEYMWALNTHGNLIALIILIKQKINRFFSKIDSIFSEYLSFCILFCTNS